MGRGYIRARGTDFRELEHAGLRPERSGTESDVKLLEQNLIVVWSLFQFGDVPVYDFPVIPLLLPN